MTVASHQHQIRIAGTMTSAVTGGKSGDRLHWSPPIPKPKGGAIHRFRVVSSDSITHRSSHPGDVTTQGPSTPQIIALR